ncbi:alpha-1A adrenergic receptor-like [Exaiptasia diaphana]|uniref:G-protein coupled receptors family 1 profile domain-containing protein n=1 Tax=Exaiptasia diaphana TaxID=2652724 RepID=A0A913XRV1_EXADI|nr:alpha-1A adrenergic receptor-like [Exaiptasia diaphana]
MASNNSSQLVAMMMISKTEATRRKPLVMVAIQASAMVVMMVVGALANGVICHCILKHTSLRTVTNIFIMNLATTDFLVCIFCMPFALISCIVDEWVFGDLMCRLEGFLLSMLCISSILTLVLIAIDRYMAIKYPLKYCTHLTNSISVFMLSTIWCYAAICSMLPALGWGSGYVYVREENICRPEFGTPSKDSGFTSFLFTSAFAVPFSVLAFLYLSILWTARKQFRQVHVAKNIIQVKPQTDESTKNTGKRTILPEFDNTCTEVTSATNTTRSLGFSTSKNRKHRRKSKTRGFKILLLIVAVFIMCWSPHFVLIFYSSIAHVKIPLEIRVITTWLAFLNSTMNPFLYGFLNGKFRSGLKRFWGNKILCCWLWKGNEESRAFHINR